MDQAAKARRGLRLRSLRLRNFLRFGDRPTEIDLDRQGLIIVVGRNGHGKSTIFDAIAFALTGRPVRATLPGRLVNNVNRRDMWVSVDLDIGDLSVRVTRGQKPGFLRVWAKPCGDTRPIESQEFSRTKNVDETQADLERLLGFNNQLFCCMVINSTRRPSFFQASSSDQKDITENLFGFTSLTAKADDLKRGRQAAEARLTTARALLQETTAARARVMVQVESARHAAAAWDSHRAADVARLEAEVAMTSHVDFDAELSAARAHARHALMLQSERAMAEARARSRIDADRRLEAAVTSARRKAEAARGDAALADAIDVAREAVTIMAAATARMSTAREEARAIDAEMAQAQRAARAASDRLSSLSDECPTCGQRWPDVDERTRVRLSLEAEAAAAESLVAALVTRRGSVRGEISEQEAIIAEARSLGSGLDSGEKIAAAEARIAAAEARISEAAEEESAAREEHAAFMAAQLAETAPAIGPAPPPSALGSEDDVIRLRACRDSAVAGLERRRAEVNPHADTLERLLAAMPTEPDPSEVRTLESDVLHRQALERMLVRKDSPIRTAVLERYLPYLNERIGHYMSRLDLDYAITFGGDLSVTVEDRGNEIDPGAISGGEAERLSMAIAWAFRDVYEEINGIEVTFSAIDERLDSGLDATGADAAVSILAEMATRRGGSLWLVTHRRDFEDHADQVLVVDRTTGFSEAPRLAA